MRNSDEGAMPPEIAAALLAVDATLAGEPADPEFDDLTDRRRRRLELAVIDLLAGDHDSSAVTRIAA